MNRLVGWDMGFGTCTAAASPPGAGCCHRFPGADCLSLHASCRIVTLGNVLDSPYLGNSARAQTPREDIAPRAGALESFQGTGPLIDLLFGRFHDPISLLNPPDQLILLASNQPAFIMSEFAPTLPGRSGKVIPLSFHLIPIHGAVSILTVEFGYCSRVLNYMTIYFEANTCSCPP
jgi:hypothetical protein